MLKRKEEMGLSTSIDDILDDLGEFHQRVLVIVLEAFEAFVPRKKLGGEKKKKKKTYSKHW